AIRVAASIGAQLSLMDDAWWGPAVPSADRDGKPAIVVAERSFPFSIVVDSQGDRYTNESASFLDFGHAMLARNAIPSWLILDARHRRRYLNNILLAGSRRLREAGIVHTAASVEDLARAIGIDPMRLRETVTRFNAFAVAGIDRDFGRGRTAH